MTRINDFLSKKHIKTRVLSALLLAVLLLLNVSCGDIPQKLSGEIGRNDVTTAAAEYTADGEAKNDTATIIMVGDVLLHTPVSESGKQADGSYNYDSLFANVKDAVQSADLALVNQEVILGGREMGLSGYPAFNGAHEVGDALINAGFDVVLHATNHALDKGKSGILSCLDYWSRHPDITVVGINKSAEARDEISVRDVNGIKVAILNYTYGTNGIPLPSDMPYAVDLLDEDIVRRDTAMAKAMSDVVIVCPHWGTEYIHTVSDMQKRWTYIFADCGVDVVIGTHPHVIEPFEEVERPDGKKMAVYYSLGNFVNATAETDPSAAERMLGAMARITLKRNENGDVEVTDHEAIPLVTHIASGAGGITTYFLDDYTPELAKVNEARTINPDFSVEYCRSLWADVFGE